MRVRMLSIQDVVEGMVLGRSIYDQNNRVILRDGVRLTTRYIKALESMGFYRLYIEDAETRGIEFVETIPEEVRMELVFNIKESYQFLAEQSIGERFMAGEIISEQFQSMFNVLFSYLRENDKLIFNMSSIYSSDAFLYNHSLNVGIFSTILAIANGNKEASIKEIGVGAMLHDIGKLFIPKEILNKPGKLTDEEKMEMNNHSKYGFDFLIRQYEISAVSAHAALQHHEKLDGTGYPRGLKGKEIHEIGRIVAVADVFDALTENRVYRKAFLPHEGLEYLFANAGSHFDPHFVELFRNHVNIYPIGMTVTLSNGYEGIVAKINKENLQRPVILVTKEHDKKIDPYELDLSKNFNVVINACEISLTA